MRIFDSLIRDGNGDIIVSGPPDRLPNAPVHEGPLVLSSSSGMRDGPVEIIFPSIRHKTIAVINEAHLFVGIPHHRGNVQSPEANKVKFETNIGQIKIPWGWDAILGIRNDFGENYQFGSKRKLGNQPIGYEALVGNRKCLGENHDK